MGVRIGGSREVPTMPRLRLHLRTLMIVVAVAALATAGFVHVWRMGPAERQGLLLLVPFVVFVGLRIMLRRYLAGRSRFEETPR
jgi:hypothetical protein